MQGKSHLCLQAASQFEATADGGGMFVPEHSLADCEHLTVYDLSLHVLAL